MSLGPGTLVTMRLQRGVLVGGVDPEVARKLARACHDRWRTTATIARRVGLQVDETAQLVGRLADAGFLERREQDLGDRVQWRTTLAGSALTMASFLKPIPRARADALLAECSSGLAPTTGTSPSRW